MALMGIDLHANSFYVVRARPYKGKIIRTEKKYGLDDQSLELFRKSLGKDDYVLIEISTNSFWFRDLIQPYVKECYILNINAVKYSGNKTDKIDARRLLDILSYYVYIKGIDELPTVYVPRPEVRELRSLLATYKLNKKIQTQLKNRIHSLLKQQGVVISKEKLFTKSGWKAAMDLIKTDLHVHIDILYAQLTEANKMTQKVRDMIISLGLQTFPKEIDLLLSIPGFGVLTSIVLLSDIDTVSRFQNAKKFCAYLRTAPRIKESNATTYLGRVTKQSRSMTCSILTQSVLHFKTAGPHLSSFYIRVRQGKSAGKSRIALIRKMLVAAYFMLKRHERFRWVDKRLYDLKKTKTASELKKARARCEQYRKESQEAA